MGFELQPGKLLILSGNYLAEQQLQEKPVTKCLKHACTPSSEMAFFCVLFLLSGRVLGVGLCFCYFMVGLRIHCFRFHVFGDAAGQDSGV